MIPNSLWCHNLLRKLASKLLCIRSSRRESKRKQRLILLFKRVSFPKNTYSFSFSSFSLFQNLGSGKNLCLLVWEIVTPSSVLDHRVWSEQVFCSIQLETCSEFSEWTLSRSLTINYLTKVIQLSVPIIALTLFIEIVDKELLKYEVENSR